MSWAEEMQNIFYYTNEKLYYCSSTNIIRIIYELFFWEFLLIKFLMVEIKPTIQTRERHKSGHLNKIEDEGLGAGVDLKSGYRWITDNMRHGRLDVDNWTFLYTSDNVDLSIWTG